MTEPYRGIAFYGPVHSGKTTAAQFAVDEGFTRLALADPLKDHAVELLNDSMSMLGINEPLEFNRDALDQGKDQYFRTLLQWLGTDWVRKYLGHENYWINRFLDTTAQINATHGFVVCDDLRFPNEAAALRDNGFVIVQVVRDEAERQASLAAANAGGIAGHASESSFDAIRPDLRLNNYDLDLLRQGVAHICEMVRNPPDEIVLNLSNDDYAEDDAA